jgi:hypothetical protein
MKDKFITFSLVMLSLLGIKAYPQADPMNARLISIKVVCLQNVILEDNLLPCHGIIFDNTIATTPECAKKAAHIFCSSGTYSDLAVYGSSAHYDLIEQIGSVYDISIEETDRGILGLSRTSPSYQSQTALFDVPDSKEDGKKGLFNQIISNVTAYYIALDSHSTRQVMSYDLSLKRLDSSSLEWEPTSIETKEVFGHLPPGTAVIKNNKLVCLASSNSQHCSALHTSVVEKNRHARRKRQSSNYDRDINALSNLCTSNRYIYMLPDDRPQTTEPMTGTGARLETDIGNCANGNITCRFEIVTVGVGNDTSNYHCGLGCEEGSRTRENIRTLFTMAIRCLGEPVNIMTTSSDAMTTSSSGVTASTSGVTASSDAMTVSSDGITILSGQSGSTTPLSGLIVPLVALQLFVDLW